MIELIVPAVTSLLGGAISGYGAGKSAEEQAAAAKEAARISAKSNERISAANRKSNENISAADRALQDRLQTRNMNQTGLSWLSGRMDQARAGVSSYRARDMVLNAVKQAQGAV